MEDSLKSLGRQKLEAEIQDAEKTREWISSEQQELKAEGVKRIFERLHEIHVEAGQAHLTPQQKKKVLAGKHVLWEDPLYKKYVSYERLRVEANKRIREATQAIRVLESGEAPPITPLPKISSAVAIAPLPSGKARSKFSSTPLLYFYFCWQVLRCMIGILSNIT